MNHSTRHFATPLPRTMAAAGILLLLAGTGAAQVPTLDRVDSLVVAGHYADARATLDQWWSAREAFEVPGSNRARALMLRARLAPDPESAEPDYLAIVLGYPMSNEAPEALLRLGQGLLADGDAGRAAAYLQRLIADYPGRPQRTLGLLWLARAEAAARRYGAACRAARQGIDDGDSPEMAALFHVEEAAACSVADSERRATPAAVAAAEPRAAPTTQRPTADTAPTPRREPARTEQPRPPARSTPAGENPAARAALGRFAVQSGAFRYTATAQELFTRLERRGYDPRTVLVPANGLLRVRVGRFATAAEAAALVSVLKSEGFDAIVVADANQERSP